LIAAFDGWRGNLYRLAVHPDHRRRGVATRLVAAGEQQLHEQGCRRITALLVRDEDHATAFWPTVGYDLDERIDRYVKTAGS
jgi:ribosomal protein S18 acetylase RimI-like enzyme